MLFYYSFTTHALRRNFSNELPFVFTVIFTYRSAVKFTLNKGFSLFCGAKTNNLPATIVQKLCLVPCKIFLVRMPKWQLLVLCKKLFIPIFSYFFNQGKCIYCMSSSPYRYVFKKGIKTREHRVSQIIRPLMFDHQTLGDE